MSQSVKLIALLRAIPGMSREEFEKRWLEEHAPLNLKFKNLKGYRVNIAMEEHQELDEEIPFDGIAELWWDSIGEMQEDLNSEEAQIAGEDADEFSSLRIHIFTREHIVL